MVSCFLQITQNKKVPQPVNIWLIIGLAVAGFLILLVIILAIYFCCKQCREKKSYSHYFYVPMAEKNARASEAAQFRPTTRNRNLTLIVIHDCNHDGEGVLRCREGDRLEVDPEDWFSPGELSRCFSCVLKLWPEVFFLDGRGPREDLWKVGCPNLSPTLWKRETLPCPRFHPKISIESKKLRISKQESFLLLVDPSVINSGPID
jgi:hypothetical protein